LCLIIDNFFFYKFELNLINFKILSMSSDIKLNKIWKDIYSVVTPINKNNKSKSNIDYNEQQKRLLNTEIQMWDDCKGNPSKNIGGLFGFVHNGVRVELHIITSINNPTNRLESWSYNVGQSDRNVLLLTPCITIIKWEKWLELGCPRKIQGTSRIVSAHNNLIGYIDSLFPSLIYIEETCELINTI
jgi:hypothetical protein